MGRGGGGKGGVGNYFKGPFTTTTTKRFIFISTDGKKQFTTSNAHNLMSTIQIAGPSPHSPSVTDGTPQ